MTSTTMISPVRKWRPRSACQGFQASLRQGQCHVSMSHLSVSTLPPLLLPLPFILARKRSTRCLGRLAAKPWSRWHRLVHTFELCLCLPYRGGLGCHIPSPAWGGTQTCMNAHTFFFSQSLLLIQSLTNPPMHSLTHPPMHSLTHSLTRS